MNNPLLLPQVIWTFRPVEPVDGFYSPSVGADGTLYVGAVATDSTAARGGGVGVGGDENYVGGGVYALDSTTGKLLWTFPTRGWVQSTIAIDGNGHLLVTSNDGTLSSLCSSDQHL